jgi:hypothetical protein
MYPVHIFLIARVFIFSSSFFFLIILKNVIFYIVEGYLTLLKIEMKEVLISNL